MAITRSERYRIVKILNQDFYVPRKAAINEDGSISVVGNLSLIKPAEYLPLTIRSITGDFNCNGLGLKSLKGCPPQVKSFACRNNKLTSLEGCPSVINGIFDCRGNQLTSLIHCPEQLMDFNCSDNNLTNFISGPKIVHPGSYQALFNDLQSLEGLPEKVDYFSLSWDPDLPLLRLLKLTFGGVTIEGNDEVHSIVAKYVGNSSRANILACQKALIDNGFEGNARW